MGTAGYKALMDERRENYKLLKDEMTKVADKYGERVLETKNNPISIGKSKSIPTYPTSQFDQRGSYTKLLRWS